MDHADMSVEDYRNAANSLPDGKAKIEVLEQAARLADAEGDIETGYKLRDEIVEVASSSGFPLKALIAFSWQLGQFDKNPGLFAERSLLWSYKWILGYITSFPEINRTQIENLLQDMNARYLAAGYGKRTYHYYRAHVLAAFGELEASRKEWDIVHGMERDSMSDCKACEQHSLVVFKADLGDDEGTLKAAEPIIRGDLSCEAVPHVTISRVLLPLLRHGKKEEADELQHKGYKLIRGKRDFLYHHGDHIGYLTLTDPLKGLEVFEEHVGYSIDHENPEDQMHFNANAANMFSRLSEENLKFQVKLPAGHPCERISSDVLALSRYFKELATATAVKLNQRNGNSYYTTLIEKLSSYRL